MHSVSRMTLTTRQKMGLLDASDAILRLLVQQRTRGRMQLWAAIQTLKEFVFFVEAR